MLFKRIFATMTNWLVTSGIWIRPNVGGLWPTVWLTDALFQLRSCVAPPIEADWLTPRRVSQDQNFVLITPPLRRLLRILNVLAENRPDGDRGFLNLEDAPMVPPAASIIGA